MAISITVRYYKSAITPPMQAYTLKAVAESATDMPKEIFVFQRPPSNNPEDDAFVCIADPVDLEEFPIGTPDLANEMPYYRKATVELKFRDLTTLDETLTLIKQDVVSLVTALKAGLSVPLYEEIVYA